jgi:DmsE family decaheme c-type cytochrome
MRWVTTIGGAMFAILGALATAENGECLSCHEATSDQPVHAIFQSAHAGIGAGNAGCVACHGESPEHADLPTENPPPLSFGPRWENAAVEQNEVCTSCHSGGGQMFWVGSVHDDEDVTCADCHVAHARRDPILDAGLQSEACYGCHSMVRSHVRLRSRHPILEGRTACVDCHNPHGTTTVAALVEPTLNDTCYRCHAEKRGPFLFEHAPATEDCGECHAPHGSVNESLLTARTPFLCQQCHSAAFHPSQLTGGDGLPNGSSSPFLLSRNCLNCHSQVHGSNHPSGARLTR